MNKPLSTNPTDNRLPIGGLLALVLVYAFWRLILGEPTYCVEMEPPGRTGACLRWVSGEIEQMKP